MLDSKWGFPMVDLKVVSMVDSTVA